MNQWMHEGFDAMRVLEIGCVLEGEADYLLGSYPGSTKEKGICGIQVLTLPERTFFVIPPGILRPNGTRPHWERPHVERARSRIFWILVLPTGAICHICSTQGGTHRNDHYLFVHDHEFHALAHVLLEEMREAGRHSETVTRHLLLILLLRIERNLMAGKFLLGGQALQPQYTLPNAEPLIQQVCGYIQENLQQPLTLPSIAAQVHISSAHLSRRFRTEMNTSVMDYVTQCRMASAKYLLANAGNFSLSIQKISTLVGFASASYFTRVFTEQIGMSPLAYREQQRQTMSTK